MATATGRVAIDWTQATVRGMQAVYGLPGIDGPMVSPGCLHDIRWADVTAVGVYECYGRSGTSLFVRTAAGDFQAIDLDNRPLATAFARLRRSLPRPVGVRGQKTGRVAWQSTHRAMTMAGLAEPVSRWTGKGRRFATACGRFTLVHEQAAYGTPSWLLTDTQTGSAARFYVKPRMQYEADRVLAGVGFSGKAVTP